MDKKTTMIIAVVAVAVVVVGGATILFNGGSDDESGFNVSDSVLHIRGNANNDASINADDLALIDEIIAGSKSTDDYPLADANNDGKVDDADKALVQDIIDRKDGTKMYVVCLDINGNTTSVEVKYPLRNVVPYGTNMQLPTLYANGGQYVVGYFKSSYAVAEASISSTAVDLKGEQRQISDAAWNNFTKLDSDLSSTGGVGAFLADYSGIAQITEKRVGDLEAAGIPLISYSSADAKSEASTVLTLGFLFGGDCETLSKQYYDKSVEIFDYIASKVATLEDKDKTSYIGCTMYIYICQNDSTFNTSAALAGGIPYYKVNSNFAKAYKGANSVKMTDREALSNYTDIGAILNTRSMDWGLDPGEIKKLVIETWEHDNSGISSTEYFKGFEDRLVYIGNLLPGAVKVAYMAHAMYGDKFDLAYSESVLQAFIDMGTNPLKGQTLDTVLAYIDYEVYKEQSEKVDVTVGDNAVDMAYTFNKNFSGKLSTGAEDAKFAFKNGSDEKTATLIVSNGNTSGYSPAENSVVIKVTKDAKSLYTANYQAYSAKIGKTAMGYTYTGANVTGDFYGISGYYLNIGTDSTSAYLSGYVKNVFFECYFYEKYQMTDEYLQQVADALYAAFTSPETYEGPAIPSDDTISEGAKLAAETFVAENSANGWSLDDGATAEKAVVTLAYKNAMGNDSTLKVTFYAGTGISAKYSEAIPKITALDGTKVSTKGSNTNVYGALTDTIPGVTYTAEFGQITNNGYVYFAIKAGDVLVDASEVKVFVSGADAEPAAKALIKSFADAALAGSSTGAKLAAINFLESNADAGWSLDDGATAEKAVVTLAYKNAMGNDSTLKVPIYAGLGIADKYAEAIPKITALDGTKVSTKGSNTNVYGALTDTIPGVTYTAEFGQITNNGYVYFAIKAGDVLVDASEVKVFVSGADAEPAAKALIKSFADAALAGSSTGAKLAAEKFIDAKIEGWTLDDGATAEKAVVTLAYKNAMGNDATLKVTYYGSDVDTRYDAAIPKITALDGTKVSTKGSNTNVYGALTDTIPGVTYTAEFGQITNNGYVYFAIKAGDVLVDASEVKVFVSGADAEPAAKALLGAFAASITA